MFEKTFIISKKAVKFYNHRELKYIGGKTLISSAIGILYEKLNSNCSTLIATCNPAKSALDIGVTV